MVPQIIKKSSFWFPDFKFCDLVHFFEELIFNELLSRGDTAAPHGFLATVGKAIESEKSAGIGDAGTENN